MYILLVNTGSGHKRKYCDKVVSDQKTGSITIWNYPDWETLSSEDFTSYSVGDSSLLLRPIRDWEWDRFHDWTECGG